MVEGPGISCSFPGQSKKGPGEMKCNTQLNLTVLGYTNESKYI